MFTKKIITKKNYLDFSIQDRFQLNEVLVTYELKHF